MARTKIKAYKEILETHGFTTEVVSAKGKTVEIKPGSRWGCIDDRNENLADPDLIHGPKLPGGLMSVPALKRSAEPLEELKRAAQISLEHGFTPALHTDKHHLIGCALWNLAAQGKLQTGSLASFSFDKAQETIEKNGGQMDILSGDHNATRLDISLVEGRTPKQTGKNFAVDPLAGRIFGLKPRQIIEMSAEVVQRATNGKLKKARLLVER